MVNMAGEKNENKAEVNAGKQPEERLTEELLKSLLTSTSPEEYLAQDGVIDRELSDYLFELLHKRDMKRAEVFRAAGINPTQGFDIFQGKSKPGRDRAIMLALGLRCSLTETQRLLRLAGVNELWCKQRRDAVIIWCIKNEKTREETDDELYRLGEKTLLGSTGPLRPPACK